MEQLRQSVLDLMAQFNQNLHLNKTMEFFVLLAIILTITILFDVLARLILSGFLPKLLRRTPKLERFGGVLTSKVLRRFFRVVTISIFKGLLPLAIGASDGIWYRLITAVCDIYIAVLLVQIASGILDGVRSYLLQTPKYRDTPFLNIVQVIKVIIVSIGVIFIISVLFNIDMGKIMTSLAAASAILMLVFKDTILGFVAGVQLSTNDMVRVGDWITVPKHGVDGDVIDISLNTVKVRNFDKTISFLPPYTLMTDSVTNWRGIAEAGMRRIKRSLMIDMHSIVYASPDMIADLRSRPELEPFIAEATVHPEDHFDPREYKETKPSVSAHGHEKSLCTNFTIFSKYAYLYLKNHAHVVKDATCIVRQLQHTENGLPLEVYCFADTNVWANYEDIQSEIFDHLMAVMPLFGLRIFQRTNGTDLQALVRDQVGLSLAQLKDEKPARTNEEEGKEA